MSTRLETEKQEAAAREADNGIAKEFLFAIPMFILSAIVWLGALMGMHYIEMGSLF
ncbi:hypothetical protein [Corynebacterium phoceense]|uniref:hypothetical protein n=1 Tax=Corynebacterium phoceense TaxID=1686286 RepID=UPI00211CD519|nr:hypothetical protein [Corynebacterium phoceense]MCQ9346554.1 hypothetical protein [Corynebacterium phoceense]